MMRPLHTRAVVFLLPLIAACAHQVDRSGTLSTLHQVRPDTEEVAVKQGLDRAVQSYGDFLKQAPESAQAPEAMRRLADLKIEKEFGLQGDGKVVEVAASADAAPSNAAATAPGAAPAPPVATPPRGQAKLRAPKVGKFDARAAARSKAHRAIVAPVAISESELEQ